ncbi:ABC-2 family transporter protein [Polystyrenella longa]|uniref:ABC-2 family transporter protein n=1 Tax=Polystyrenella longa TaxID=2528007 RepID=A0A518CPH4_9PLAN|nr:ABC transporter permease subunit/CPBP intramembrane protease [Polystyrenella longa]QDU81113.1 ABC-2 family transporter protein [Polystyrenella longa]
MTVRFWRLTLKELRETLRDRRTVGTLILMPMLVYPLLGIILHKFLFTQIGSFESSEYIVCCENNDELDRLKSLYSQGSHFLREAAAADRQAEQVEEDDPRSAEELAIEQIIQGGRNEIVLTFKLISDYGTSYENLLTNRQIDLFIRSTGSSQPQGERGPPQEQLEIVYIPGVSLSENALYHLQQRLQAVNQNFVAEFLKSHGDAELPVSFDLAPLEDKEAGPISIATVIPLILILMTVTGAVYPAIDLTAGERERQTLETLISAPISRISLLQAKYIAVLTVAMLTAIINLCSMMVTIFAIGVDQLIFDEGSFSLLFLMQVLGMLFVFASFFSAVLLCVTSFARSFKEAQAYLIPLMLVSIAPGVLCLLPGIKLSSTLAWVPLINMVMLGRDLFSGGLSFQTAIIVISSTLFYTWISLFIASRIFGTDAILYGSEGSWSDLWKSRQKQHEVPTLSNALICLAILIPVFMNASRILSRFAVDALATDAHSMLIRSLMSILITVVLFAGLPLLFTVISHSRISSTFCLKRPRLNWFGVAFLYSLSLWPFLYEFNVLFSSESAISEMKSYFSSFEEGFANLSLFWKLLAYAIVPAVCEELFFRGFLFSACRTSYSKWTTILLTSFLFGLFHVIAANMLLGRFFPSFALGVLLGLLRWYSGSLYPGMVFHVLHNGLLLTISTFPKEISEYFDWASEEASHLPMSVLVGAFLVALVATFWFLRERKIQKRLRTQTSIDQV